MLNLFGALPPNAHDPEISVSTFSPGIVKIGRARLNVLERVYDTNFRFRTLEPFQFFEQKYLKSHNYDKHSGENPKSIPVIDAGHTTNIDTHQPRKETKR